LAQGARTASGEIESRERATGLGETERGAAPMAGPPVAQPLLQANTGGVSSSLPEAGLPTAGESHNAAEEAMAASREEPPPRDGEEAARAEGAGAAGAAGAQDADAVCPISGKVGLGCPMSLMGIGASGSGKDASASSTKAATPAVSSKTEEAGRKAKAAGKASFASGKSLIASVQKPTTSQDSFLYRLCPLNWDSHTMKLVAIVATVSWASGAIVGWSLHAMMR